MLGFLKNMTKEHFPDPIAAIGKLPVHNEFIKFGVTSNELALLDQWLQDAYRWMHHRYDTRKIKYAFSHMPLYSFIDFINGSELRIGTLSAGQDKNGRAYPFILLRMIKHPVALEMPSLIPIIYQDYFQHTGSLCASNWNNKTTEECFAQIKDTNKYSVDIERKPALENSFQQLSNITFKEFWSGLVNLLPHLTQAFFCQILIDVVNEVNQGDYMGLRLPLPLTENLAPYVSFWLQVTEEIIERQATHVYWHGKSENHYPSIIIYLKAIEPAQFRQLMFQNENEGLVDMLQLLETSRPAFEENTQDMSQENDSLLQVMQSWCEYLSREKP